MTQSLSKVGSETDLSQGPPQLGRKFGFESNVCNSKADDDSDANDSDNDDSDNSDDGDDDDDHS